MKTRYFVITGQPREIEEFPEGSIVNSHMGARVDYQNYSHELTYDCDCRHCVALKSQKELPK